MSDNNTAQEQQDGVQAIEQRMAQIAPQIEQFKTDWEIIKGIKDSLGAARSEIQQAYSDIKTELATIAETKAGFEGLKKQTKSQHDSLNVRIEDLSNKIQEVENLRGSLSGLLGDTQQIKQEAEQNKNKVLGDVQAFEQIRSDFESLRNQAQSVQTDLQGRQTDAQGKISEIYDLNAKLTELHDELLVDDRDESNNIIGECVSSQINALHEQVKATATDMISHRDTAKIETENLKRALEKEIRSLLPEAGAAGLSSAYVQAKSKYGPIPFDGKPLSWQYAGYLFKTYAPITINYAMFIVPLIVMMGLFVDLFKDLQSSEINEKVMLFRFLIALPLAAISLFGWSSISLSRRLFEEYNHKQRVMQLYHSFKEEVDKHGDAEHKKALLSIMLRAVDDKPSLTMQRYENGLGDIIPSIGKIFGSGKAGD